MKINLSSLFWISAFPEFFIVYKMEPIKKELRHMYIICTRVCMCMCYIVPFLIESRAM